MSGSYDTTMCVWKPRVAARPPPRSVGSRLSVASSVSSGPSGGGTSVIWDCIEQLGVEDNDVLTQSVRSLCCINVASHAAGGRNLPGADAGRVIASGHGDGCLKMWQVGVSSPIAQADGHFDDERDSAVTCVLSVENAASAAASYVASASEDGTVKLWTVASLLDTRARGKGNARPVTTLCREQASAGVGLDGQMLSVDALALVHAGTVPILAVAAGESIDLWQIVGV
jgi:WD40 repeat protein